MRRLQEDQTALGAACAAIVAMLLREDAELSRQLERALTQRLYPPQLRIARERGRRARVAEQDHADAIGRIVGILVVEGPDLAEALVESLGKRLRAS